MCVRACDFGSEKKERENMEVLEGGNVGVKNCFLQCLFQIEPKFDKRCST